ncbi:MAG TPA: lipoprotein-releasing system ATP-binding protein LolD [Bacteroidales bacterium]|nr:lipoprotein-releasing system ATP-binding protein LolD [Bacteroidales bacterium]
MIKTRGIFKSYGAIHVLKDIHLDIDSGEIIGITGASGAGKTTLLQILGTLDRPDKGEMEIAGQNVFALNDKALADFRNQHIGFVFQFHHLLPEFTSLENVCLPGFIGKKPRKQVEKRAAELLDFLQMSHRLDHKPNQLSGGEQQRIAIARALINSPKLILADEPSGNLDSENTKELHKLFFALRQEFKQTFVIVTHNIELANMCDRKLVLKDGSFEI